MKSDECKCLFVINNTNALKYFTAQPEGKFTINPALVSL
jgi:hypothetical protein